MTVEFLNPEAPSDDGPTPKAPTILSRTIAVPPGPPWDQARAADLEARLGAPLPIGELKYKLKRLSTWSPQRPGRFAAFYLRAADYAGPFETVVRVDGASVTVAFGAKARQLTQVREGAAALGAAALAVLLIAGGVGAALSARSDADASVSRAEALAQARSRTLEKFRRGEAAVAAARTLARGRTPVSELVADLDWAGAGRAPDARILAAHLYQGMFAVEARGPRSPFTSTDRTVARSDRPVHDDVWLWAVERASATPSPGAKP